MPSSPIQIRLATTDVTDIATWNTKEGSIPFTQPDPLYDGVGYTQIQNPIEIAYLYYKTAGLYPGVGTLRSNETNSSAKGGGGFYLGGTQSIVESPFTETTIGAVNRINISNLAALFMNARNQDGMTFSLIINGKQDTFTTSPPFPQYAEANYVRGAGANPVVFDANTFYKVSTWISFHSREADIPKIQGSASISLRKNFHHGLINLLRSDVAGISQQNGVASLRSNDTFNWNNVPGLSANSLCTFAQYPSEIVSATASKPGMSPQIISCSGKQMTFVGISGFDAVFTDTPSETLFSGANSPIVNTLLNWGNSDYASTAGEAQWYTIPSTISLVIRPRYAITYGTKNYLALRLTTETQTRFFGGSNNLGIEPGSYVRISGAQNSSNNGVYQVLSIQDGVPNDTTENTPFPKYQYIELSRDISPQEESITPMTVENVSKLPILHIKYTKVLAD